MKDVSITIKNTEVSPQQMKYYLGLPIMAIIEECVKNKRLYLEMGCFVQEKELMEEFIKANEKRKAKK